MKHLTTFIGNKNPRLDEIDDAWLTEFKYYLLEEHKEKGKRSLMANTAHSYFNKVRSALTNAFDRNLIEKNPADLVSAIRVKESKREFLTIAEVRKLAEAPCEELYLKEAFLFSVLTGLRWADIFHLTWNEIHENENGAYIHLEQKKTNKYLVLPITNEALQLLGERKEPFERIFRFLRYSSQTSVCLSRWMLKAGITKKI